MPNVRVEAGPTARCQALAGENAPRTTGPGAGWVAVGPRLDRGVRPLHLSTNSSLSGKLIRHGTPSQDAGLYFVSIAMDATTLSN